jgi:hypothetical protein
VRGHTRAHARTHTRTRTLTLYCTHTHTQLQARAQAQLTIYEAVLNPYARYSRLWLSTGACTRACTPSHSAPNASPGLLTSHSARFIPRYCSAMHRPQLQHYQHTSDSLFPSKTHFQCVSMSRCRPRCTAVHTDNTRSIYVCSATSIFRLGNQIVDV